MSIAISHHTSPSSVRSGMKLATDSWTFRGLLIRPRPLPQSARPKLPDSPRPAISAELPGRAIRLQGFPDPAE